MTHQLGFLSVEQSTFTKDDYYTPDWVFDALGLEFDLDVAAPPGGVPWIPARHFYTQADDGLAQPWDGLVWCNPPFSGAAKWARRFIEHGNGVLIASIPGDSGWFPDLMATGGVAWMGPRGIKFHRPEYDKPHVIPWPVFTVGLGDGVPGVLRLRDRMGGIALHDFGLS